MKHLPTHLQAQHRRVRHARDYTKYLLRALACLALLCGAQAARADWFYRFIGYTCDRQSDQLVVYYKGAWNDAGAAMRKAIGRNEFEPYTFIASMRDEDHIGRLRTVTRVCVLRHGWYRLRFGATPGNRNIQGQCGAEISAWAEVSRGDRRVLPRHEMEGGCFDRLAPVTTRIVFRPGLAPSFTSVLPDEFTR